MKQDGEVKDSSTTGNNAAAQGKDIPEDKNTSKDQGAAKEGNSTNRGAVAGKDAAMSKDSARSNSWVKFRASLFTSFSSYLYLGVLMLLLSIILEMEFPGYKYVSVVCRLIGSVGVAIIVASIFTYVSGTAEFMEKIKKLLQDIVVSRSFLGNVDGKKKKEAMKALIKSSTEEEVYSNIESYLNTYINKTMDVASKCVRSSYTVHARAYIDKDKIRVDSSISYRLYPSRDGYSEIKVGFLESETDSVCGKVIVSPPRGERKVVEEFKYEDIVIDAGKARLATVGLSEFGEEWGGYGKECDDFGKGCDRLDISLEMSEYGTDRLMMLALSALQPTDGFSYKLRCEDGLTVSKFHTFIHGAKFHVELSPDKKEITASCNEWVNEGTGISILIMAGSVAPKGRHEPVKDGRRRRAT